MTKATPKNHYDTLRLERHASPQRVRDAYRRMAQRFHPDKHQGSGDAAALMAQINEAYAVLSDPAGRAAYDASLQPRGVPEAARARVAAMAVQDRIGWAGWLLLAIASIAVLTLGYVTLKTVAPAAPAFHAPVAAPMPVADNTPITPVRRKDNAKAQ
jgi:preprotein translocase subunit Sec63